MHTMSCGVRVRVRKLGTRHADASFPEPAINQVGEEETTDHPTSADPPAHLECLVFATEAPCGL